MPNHQPDTIYVPLSREEARHLSERCTESTNAPKVNGYSCETCRAVDTNIRAALNSPPPAPLREAVEGVVAELERRRDCLAADAESAHFGRQPLLEVEAGANDAAASFLRKTLDQHPVGAGGFNFEEWCAVDDAMAFAIEYGSEERVDKERLADLRHRARKSLGQPAAQHPPEREQDEDWPTFVVQRLEEDDPIRPFKYVVLDGTQSTDFTNCHLYVPSDQGEGRLSEEDRSRLRDIAERFAEEADTAPNDWLEFDAAEDARLLLRLANHKGERRHGD